MDNQTAQTIDENGSTVPVQAIVQTHGFVRMSYVDGCNCLTCCRVRGDKTEWGWPIETAMMIVCAKCGNKRCPKATDHVNECTNSNEPGQKGSIYGLR